MQKAISTVIATIMLLLISVSLISVFYVFSSTLAGTTTSSGGQQASQLTSQLAMCMQIDNILGNQVTLRNCGKGTIENKSLVVMIDDIILGASTQIIQEGNSSVVNVSGLWQIPFGKRNLKISNGAAFALALVDVQPNKEGLVGSWSFNEGSGTFAGDGSGNGNTGTLLPAGSEPQWISGKSGKGLQFDGVNDYVDAGNWASLNTFTDITVGAWVKTSGNGGLQNTIIAISGGYGYGGFTFGGSSTVWAEFNSLGNVNNFQGVDSGVNYQDNNWHYLVLTVAGTTVNMYKDNVSIKTATLSGNVGYVLGQHAYIGRRQYGGSEQWYKGIIDEVRIWNRALAPDDTIAMKQII